MDKKHQFNFWKKRQHKREENINLASRDIVHRFVRTNDDDDDVLKHHIWICFSNLRLINYLNLDLVTKIDTGNLKINNLPMRKTKLLTKIAHIISGLRSLLCCSKSNPFYFKNGPTFWVPCTCCAAVGNTAYTVFLSPKTLYLQCFCTWYSHTNNDRKGEKKRTQQKEKSYFWEWIRKKRE